MHLLYKNTFLLRQLLVFLCLHIFFNNASAQTTAAKLAITNVVGVTTAKLGDKITLQVTVKNTGSATSSATAQVAIVRQYLGYVPFPTYQIQGTAATLAPLAANASITIPLSYTIVDVCNVMDPRQVCIPDIGGASALVQVAGIGTEFMPPVNRGDKVIYPNFTLTPTIPSVDLSTTLQLTSTFVDANSNFKYRIIVKNNGLEKATNITLIPSKGTEIDPCQDGTILSMTASKGKVDKNACPNTYFWTGFDLNAGETATCDIEMNLKGTAVQCFAFNYKVAVSQLFFCGKDTNAANNLAMATFDKNTPIVPTNPPTGGAAKLTILSILNTTPTAKVGDKITLQVTVKNTGSATSSAKSQVAIVRKQTGFIFPYQDIAQGTPVDIAPLAAGSTRVITLMYTIETACDMAEIPCTLDRSGLSPTLQVAGIGADFMPAADADKVVFPTFQITPSIPNIDLVTSIQQIGTGIPAGGNLKYRITLKNNGPDRATNITLVPKDGTSGCEIDKILQLTVSKGMTGTACNQETIAYWGRFSLASGESATCEVEMGFTRNPLTGCPTLATYNAMVSSLNFCGKDTNEANNLATATLSKAEAPASGTYFYANSITILPANPNTTNDVTINVVGSYANPCSKLINSSYAVIGNQINITMSFGNTGGICTQQLVPATIPIKLGKLPAGDYCVNFIGTNYEHTAFDKLTKGKCFSVSATNPNPTGKATLTITAEPQMYKRWGYNKITVTVHNQTRSALTSSQILIGIGSSSKITDTLIIAEEVGKKSVISKGTRFANAWTIGTMPPNTKETWTFYTFAKLLGKAIPIKAYLIANLQNNPVRESAITTLIPNTTTGGIIDGNNPPVITLVGKDIAITLTANPTTYTQYKNLTFKATVTNHSLTTVNGIKASFQYIELGKLPFVQAKMTKGSYDAFNKIWNVGTLNSEQSATLEITLFPLVKGEALTMKTTLVPNDDKPLNNTATISVANNVAPRTEPIIEKGFGISKIYPNPVQEAFILALHSDKATKATIEIYNSMGLSVQSIEKLLEQGMNEWVMNTSELPEGVFIVRVVNENGASSLRTIVK